MGQSTPAEPAALDPRISLVESQLTRAPNEALEAVEAVFAADAEQARRYGLDYLRAHLLLVLDRRPEAMRALAATLGSTPRLEPFGRYRLALEQERGGHPEVAAGLVATLLGNDPPKSLVPQAMELLRRTIGEGGDCRLLSGLARQPYRERERRQLTLARADCALRQGDDAAYRQLLQQILENDRRDDVALAAAERLAALEADRSLRTTYLIALTLYDHRAFDDAIVHLGRLVQRLDSTTEISRREAFESRYALARSHFWLERFELAASAFGALAETTRLASRRAQARFQQARSLELDRSWPAASQRFQEAYLAEPNGRWADSALIGLLRLQWLLGNEENALALLEALLTKRHHGTATRALIFLASSELVQERSERAAGWLQRAARLGRVPRQELAYWQGRAAELAGRLDEAVPLYVEVLRLDPFHPFAAAARHRLDGEGIRRFAQRQALIASASGSATELYGSWLVLGDEIPQGRRARARLQAALAGDPAARPFLDLEPQPAASWPMWRTSLDEPEEMLLALGLFDEGAPAVIRHFPIAQPNLAFTGSLSLAKAGEINRSLYIAEILHKRTPRGLPTELLPETYRRLLYPFAYSFVILRETERHGVDPFLLTALIREESRFDTDAFSAAAARGLTQFVLPTARRIAAKIDHQPFAPHHLDQPPTAIAFGAAYLGELADRFAGAEGLVIAAYNAGEPVAELWRRYCYNDSLEEYLSKIAYRETRAYVGRVLRSRAHYRDLYGNPPP